MTIVNPIYLHDLFNPLIGGADDEATIEMYGHYRSDDEDDVKELALDILLPQFKRQKPILQEAVKNTLAYYLAYPKKINFESIFDSLLLPIDTPSDTELFFRWIWEVFFPGESNRYIVSVAIKEEFEVDAPYYFLTGKKRSRKNSGILKKIISYFKNSIQKF